MEFLIGMLTISLCFACLISLCSSDNTTFELYTRCEGRCGDWDNIPCSCHPKCIVYQNCCWDFSLACVAEGNKSRELYGHMSPPSLLCAVDGFLMINSCPNDMLDSLKSYETTTITRLQLFRDSVSHKFKPENTSTTTDSIFRGGIKPQTISPDLYKTNFQTILKRRPVFDNFSGLLYSNADTFFCNSVPDSSPFLWEVEIGADSMERLEGINFIESEIEWKYVRYRQPKVLGSMPLGARCIPASITRCPDRHKYIWESAYEKCKNGDISYVQNVLTSIIYKNPHCYVCWLIYRTSMRDVNEYDHGNDFVSTFSLLVGSSVSSGRLTIRSSDPQHISANAWKEMDCNINPQEDQGIDIDRCQAKQCDEYSVRDTRGFCVQAKYLNIAIGQAGFPLGSREKYGLKGFLECCLTSKLGFEIIHEKDDNSSSIPASHFADSINEMLYVTKVVVYSQGTIAPLLEKTEHIRDIDILNKALALYIMNLNDRDVRHMDLAGRMHSLKAILRNESAVSLYLRERPEPWFNQSLNSSSSLTSINTTLLEDIDQSLYYTTFGANRSKVYTDSLPYTACVCEHHKGDDCQLVCWRTPLCAEDIAYITSHYLDSTCFDIFEASVAGRNSSLRSVFVLIIGHIVFTIVKYYS